MNRIRSFWVRILNLFRRSKLESDLADQLEAHREMIRQDLIEQGMEPAQADRKARQTLGNDVMVRELSRDEWFSRFIDEVIRDIRHGFRTLAHHKAFTIVAAISLAIGIGANTFIFSLTNSTLLNPLGYPEPDRLVTIWTVPDRNHKLNTGITVETTTTSVTMYLAIREQARSFEDVGAFNGGACGVRTLGGDGPGTPAERVYGQCFTPSLFRLLGVKPFIGRTFTDDEDRLGNVAPVILISHSMWRRRFGSDASIVGKNVMLNQVPMTIIGVLPEDFRLFRDANVPAGSRTPQIDFIAPLEFGSTQVRSRRGGNTIVARLKPNVSLEQGQSEIDAIAAEQGVRDPELHEGLGVRAEYLGGVVHRDYRLALLLLQGAVGFVLLISCANVAGLLLARNSSRRHEVRLRIALGAGRRRIIRQLIAESLPLAIVGGVIGVSVAIAALSLYVTRAPAELALFDRGWLDILDKRVLAFTTAVVVATIGLFAALPAIHSVRSEANDPLRETMRTVTAGGHRQRLRSALVTGQIALSLVLLIGAGLMINSFARVVTKDLGADPTNLLSFSFNLPPAETITVTSMYRGLPLGTVSPKPSLLVERLLEKLANVPGVVGVTATNAPPFAYRPIPFPFLIEGRTKTTANQPDTADYVAVTRGFFRQLKIPLMKGRDFDEHDNENGHPVIIINEAMARQFFPSENPIGKRITLDYVPDERPREIVGVVGDTVPAMQSGHHAMMYVPHLQQTSQWIGIAWGLRSGMYFLVRASGDPGRLIPAVKAAVADVDPNTPAADLVTVEQILDNQTRTLRFYMFLLGVFATVAVLMAATGIYGVLAYSVAERTREIGIRMALGGRSSMIVAMVLRQAAWIIGAGLIVGLIGATALSGLLQSLLFEVGATDVATYVAISWLVLLISVFACVIPARRAATVDPVQALKHE
jgi:putative ABC transport system permease protein